MIHFVTSRPRTDRCLRCHRLRLTGLAGGLPYTVDPAPLTLRAELAARLAGRESYWLTGGGLAWRTVERIKADGIRGRPIVFADHRCAVPVAASDVDTTYLGFASRMLADFESGCEWGDAEFATFTVLAHRLGARVIESDTPPF